MGQDASVPERTTLIGAGGSIPAALKALKLNLRCFVDDRFEVYQQVVRSSGGSTLNQRIYYAQHPGDATHYSIDIHRNRVNEMYGAVVTV